MSPSHIALTCSLLFASCTTTDPATIFDGKPLTQVEPAPYAIAVLPVKYEQSASAAPLHFVLSEDDFTDRLVTHLQTFNTATKVTRAADENSAADADLVIRPVLKGDRAFTHVGVSDNWLAGGTFWFLTLIGGMVVQDATYRTEAGLECVLSSRSKKSLASQSTGINPVDCTYLERNRFPSLRFLECLVLPPFWTTDDSKTTSASLSDRAALSFAASLSKYLKGSFNDQVIAHGSLKLVSPPRNGGDLAGNVRMTLSSLSPLDVLEISVNDAAEPVVTEPPPRDDRGVTTIDLDASLFRPGSNLITVMSRVKGQGDFTRTIRINRP